MKRGFSVVLRAAEAASSQGYVPQHPWAQHLFQRTPESLGTLGSKPGSLLCCGFEQPKLGIAYCSGYFLQTFLGTQISCAKHHKCYEVDVNYSQLNLIWTL